MVNFLFFPQQSLIHNVCEIFLHTVTIKAKLIFQHRAFTENKLAQTGRGWLFLNKPILFLLRAMVHIFKCSHQDQSWWGEALTEVLLWFVLAQLVTGDGPSFQKHSAAEREEKETAYFFSKNERCFFFITVWYKVWRGGVVALRVPSWWLEDGGGGWCPARRLGIWKTAEELDLTQMWKYFSSQTAIELSSRLVSKARAYWATKGRIQWVHIYSNV